MMHDSLLNFHSVFLDTLYRQKAYRIEGISYVPYYYTITQQSNVRRMRESTKMAGKMSSKIIGINKVNEKRLL